MVAHLVSLVDTVSSLENDKYYECFTKFFKEYKKDAKHIRKRDRCGMVMYGLLLYALKQTDYKYHLKDYEECLTDDEERIIQTKCNDLSPALLEDVKRQVLKSKRYRKYLDQMCESLCPLLMALARGGDFPAPPIDCKDMPLEFVIESVKVSVPEQES